jgi:hypothetical protein
MKALSRVMDRTKAIPKKWRYSSAMIISAIKKLQPKKGR